jgi:chromosome segregation ATPase
MSVQRMSVPAKDQDLEATAELPVLDIASFESKGAPEKHGPDAAETTKDPAYSKQLARLEDDLRSLSTTLRDVEERLGLKGQRLAEIERELEAERTLRAAADQRVENVTRELAQTHTALSIAQSRIGELTQNIETRDTVARTQHSRLAELESHIADSARALDRAHSAQREMEMRVTGYVETLSNYETRRGVFDVLLRSLDGEVGARDLQLSRLQKELLKFTNRVSELETDLAARAKRIGSLETEVNKLAGALTSTNDESSVKERANDELRKTVARLTTEAFSQTERIRTIEADANARAQEHMAALRAAAEMQRELEAAKVSQKHRIDALEAQLASISSELETRTSALQAAETQQRELQNRLTQAENQIRAQEESIADHNATARRLHDELRLNRESLETAEGDLRAAEDTINRLEAELRAKAAKIDELTKTQEEWRATVEAARQALDERDTAIRRLETEAAHSAALLDNIQLSIKRMDPPAAATPGANGSELAPEGATRLLTRTDGESEVVHVLGRKTTIGRTPDNDLQIDTKFISRHHAVILAAPAHTIIEDLNSTNGVMVNGRRIRRHPLKDGDMVAIGKTQFRFSVRQPPTSR